MLVKRDSDDDEAVVDYGGMQPWQGAGTTITQPVFALLFISTIFVGWQMLDARRQREAGQPHWSLAAAGGRSTVRGYLRLFL